MSVLKPWPKHKFVRYPAGHANQNAKGCLKCGMPEDHPNHETEILMYDICADYVESFGGPGDPDAEV